MVQQLRFLKQKILLEKTKKKLQKNFGHTNFTKNNGNHTEGKLASKFHKTF